MEHILLWLQQHPSGVDGFIGGFIASLIVVTIYDRWTITRRRPRPPPSTTNSQPE